MENSTAAIVGDPPSRGMRTSEHPIFWNGVYPSFLPTEVNIIIYFIGNFFLFTLVKFFLPSDYKQSHKQQYSVTNCGLLTKLTAYWWLNLFIRCKSQLFEVSELNIWCKLDSELTI